MSKLERQNGIIAGVCGGLGKQMNLNPWIIRIGLIVVCTFTLGLPIVAYIVGVVAIPKANELPPGQQPPSLEGNGPTTTNANTAFCSNCGTKNAASNKFCQSCGNGL